MKKSNVINLFMYRIYLYLIIMICLFSCPNRSKNKNNKSDIPLSYGVIALDERGIKDPNIRVIDSHRITDINKMKKIIEEILEYDKSENEYNWNRSAKSMEREWLVHNICYFLGIETQRTSSVDFTNSEEDIYLFKLTKD